MVPYYEDELVTIYHAPAAEAWDWLGADVLLTDPPFGIDYQTRADRRDGFPRSIEGDKDTLARDEVLAGWGQVRPALVFGSWKARAPGGERTRLVWDQDGALGMGDLSLPWKPSWQVIHVIGGPWAGSRDCGSVLRCPPVQSVGRVHPHEKPVRLLSMLLAKCIPGTVADPFMGSGSTLVAAKRDGRRAIGCDVDERYCETAATRCSQGVLDFGAAS